MLEQQSEVQRLYALSSEAVRSKFGLDVESAAAHYRRYATFVSRHAPKSGSAILDLGCGEGWSTWILRTLGHQAEGLDLHANELEARRIDPALVYTQGDIQRLPFADATFDVVCLNNVLEHVPDPARALAEMARVVRPGGRVIVVGPHLLSFPANVYWATFHTRRMLREGKLWERRGPDLPRHPGGNTAPEAWAGSVMKAYVTFRKLFGEHPVRFKMRSPDLVPPFHADNDSCYYCNPMDVLNWAKTQPNLKPIQWWADDRRGSRRLWPFLGGTWVVLESRSAKL